MSVKSVYSTSLLATASLYFMRMKSSLTQRFVGYTMLYSTILNFLPNQFFSSNEFILSVSNQHHVTDTGTPTSGVREHWRHFFVVPPRIVDAVGQLESFFHLHPVTQGLVYLNHRNSLGTTRFTLHWSVNDSNRFFCERLHQSVKLFVTGHNTPPLCNNQWDSTYQRQR